MVRVGIIFCNSFAILSTCEEVLIMEPIKEQFLRPPFPYIVVAEVCLSIGSSLAVLEVGFLNTSGGEVLEL